MALRLLGPPSHVPACAWGQFAPVQPDGDDRLSQAYDIQWRLSQPRTDRTDRLLPAMPVRRPASGFLGQGAPAGRL